MEEEKKVSEETKAKIPNANPYKKDREDDPEVEAFAKGELSKYQRNKKRKRQPQQPNRRTPMHLKRLQKNQIKRLLLSLNALLKLKIVFLRNVMTI